MQLEERRHTRFVGTMIRISFFLLSVAHIAKEPRSINTERYGIRFLLKFVTHLIWVFFGEGYGNIRYMRSDWTKCWRTLLYCIVLLVIANLFSNRSDCATSQQVWMKLCSILFCSIYSSSKQGTFFVLPMEVQAPFSAQSHLPGPHHSSQNHLSRYRAGLWTSNRWRHYVQLGFLTAHAFSGLAWFLPSKSL